MKTCPKCGKKISKKVTTCPHCHKPILKTTPPKDFKVNNIPLKVKKVKHHKNNKTNTISLKTNIITLILLILLIIINISLLTIYFKKPEEQPIHEELNNSKATIELSNLGGWISQNNELFLFAKDNKFYWYDSYLKQDDNYYEGTYNYKSGAAALEEMGYTEEEFYNTFGQELSLDNVYSLNIVPNALIKKQENITNTLKEDETWWFLLIIKNEETAIAYNKTLELEYDLTKYNNR